MGCVAGTRGNVQFLVVVVTYFRKDLMFFALTHAVVSKYRVW